VISYIIDSEFEDNEIGGGFSHLNDSNYFASKYQIDGGVTINEIFAPLFGIDVKWNNDMSTKFEYKQSRTMTLSFSNNQILETASKEFIIGFGYKIPNLEIPLSIQGTQRLFKSDLNFRFDFTYRDAITVIRRISENENQASAGQSSYSLRVNADYNLDKITMNIFYNYDMTDPIVSTTYKTSNTYVGFSLRFNLANL
jgi:cell surface protein SprA